MALARLRDYRCKKNEAEFAHALRGDWREVGADVEKFATAEHFASWMGLCPDNRVTGRRTHAAHTLRVQNRLANALRVAAQSLRRSKSGLGDCFGS